MDTTRRPEEILERIGGCGRFQIMLSIITHCVKTPAVMTILLMVFSVATPEWWCADKPEILDNLNATLVNIYSLISNVSRYSEQSIQNETPNPLFNRNSSLSEIYNDYKNCKNYNRTKCTSLQYSETMKTIVSEWKMSCTLSWIPSTIASLQMVGLFFGNLVGGQIADTFGRKAPWLGSLVVIIIGNLIGYFSTSWLMFGIARILCGIALGTFLTAQYSLATEVSLARWRPWIVAFPSWPIISCLFCLVMYLMPDWRKLHLLTVITTAPFLLLWKFVPESFRWQMSHDRTNEAKTIIQRIGKFNRHPVSDETLMTFLNTDSSDEDKGDKKKYTILHIFKTKQLAKTTVLSGMNWLALGLLSYGIQYGVQALSGNFFLNMFLFSIITLPTTFIAIVLSNSIGRRKTVMMTYVIATAGCLVVGILQHIETDLRGPLTNGFAMFASLGISLAWGPVQLMTLELYPTVVRNIGYGFLNTFARVGAVLGPQLAYLDTKLPGVMYFICSGVSACCIVATYFLAETRGAVLDDKIQKLPRRDTVAIINVDVQSTDDTKREY